MAKIYRNTQKLQHTRPQKGLLEASRQAKSSGNKVLLPSLDVQLDKNVEAEDSLKCTPMNPSASGPSADGDG